MPVFGCRQVLGVFNGREWGHIDSHLQDMLGRHAAETGDFEAAASHFAATLACTEAHPNRQRQLLEQFLKTLRRLTPEQANHHADWKPHCPSVSCNPRVCNSNAAMLAKLADGAEYLLVQVEKLAYQLPLPAVDLEHMDVSSDDAFTFANADARSYPEAFWKRLAAPLLAGEQLLLSFTANMPSLTCLLAACWVHENLLAAVNVCPWLLNNSPHLAGQDTVAATWLDGGKKSGAAVPDRVAVVGEEIGLDVDMHNPLALELHVSRLQASVEASTAGSFQVADIPPTQFVWLVLLHSCGAYCQVRIWYWRHEMQCCSTV